MKRTQMKMSKCFNAIGYPLAIITMSFGIAACSGAPSTFEKSIVSSLTKVGLISPEGPSRAIDYSPRAPLVLPPTERLAQPILPPEDVKLSPRELAKIYYPDHSKITLKQYEALIAQRRELEAKGEGVSHLKPSAFSGTEDERIRYQRLKQLTYPRSKYFEKISVPGDKETKETTEASQ